MRIKLALFFPFPFLLSILWIGTDEIQMFMLPAVNDKDVEEKLGKLSEITILLCAPHREHIIV